MSRAQRTVLGLLAVVVASLAAGLVVLQLQRTGASARDYPAGVRETFLVACTANTDDEFCVCALEAIEDTYTLHEYHQMERQVLATGRMTPQMAQVIADC